MDQKSSETLRIELLVWISALLFHLYPLVKELRKFYRFFDILETFLQYIEYFQTNLKLSPLSVSNESSALRDMQRDETLQVFFSPLSFKHLASDVI